MRRPMGSDEVLMEPFIFRDGGVFVFGLVWGVMLCWLHRKRVMDCGVGWVTGCGQGCAVKSVPILRWG